MKPEQLRQWRHRLGLSSSAMSVFLGIPGHTYAKWEKGLREPSAAGMALLEILHMAETVAPNLFNARITLAWGSDGQKDED